MNDTILLIILFKHIYDLLLSLFRTINRFFRKASLIYSHFLRVYFSYLHSLDPTINILYLNECIFLI